MAQTLERTDHTSGEVTPLIQGGDTSLVVALAQAELNQAVTTARAFPRSVTLAKRNITSLATLDDETAEECVYALPRAGKAIRGPSVRLAEIIASQWGNCHVASRVVAVDKFEKVVIAEGVFHDLETGLKRTAQITRRITDKQGRLFNDDMIIVTGNAAASIAMREAVLKGIPKAVWREAYANCEQVIAGDVKTIAERREGAFKAFAAVGVSPDQIYAALEVGGVDDVGADELVTLTAWRNQIKEGETTVEDLFPKNKPAAGETAPKGTASKLDKIAEAAKPTAPASTQTDSAARAAQPATQTAPAADQGGSGGQQETAAQTQASPAQSDDQAEDDDTPAADGIADEEIEAAFERGKKARKAGMAAKAVPTEWRDPAKKRLADAWKAGHADE